MMPARQMEDPWESIDLVHFLCCSSPTTERITLITAGLLTVMYSEKMIFQEMILELKKDPIVKMYLMSGDGEARVIHSVLCCTWLRFFRHHTD